jgi:hypothetical protein
MHERSGNILQQWKDLEGEFPRLSKMARDILAVPAAGVGCERIFSVAGSIYDHRKNFNPETFFVMMMIRFHDQKENADAVWHLDLEEHESMSVESINLEMQKRHEDLVEVFQKVYISDEEGEEDEEVRDVTTNVGSTIVVTTRNIIVVETRNVSCLIIYKTLDIEYRNLILIQKGKGNKRTFKNRQSISSRGESKRVARGRIGRARLISSIHLLTCY